MTTALITGAAGFVGHHLADLLHRDGVDVVPFDLRHGDDLRDYEQVRAALDAADPDLVFHLAAQAYVAESTTDPRRAVDVNTVGTLHLLEALRHTGSRARILLAGTSEEYGYGTQPPDRPVTEDSTPWPTTPYGVSKLAATQLGLVYARLYGLHVVITRAWNHTGPGRSGAYADAAFARRIVAVERGQATEVVHGNLDAVRNYTDVRDIVAAYRLAVDLPAGVYNLCSERTVSMQTVLDILVSYATVPVKTRLDEALYRPSADTFPTPSCARFAAATGWRPRILLEETLRDVLGHWRDRP